MKTARPISRFICPMALLLILLSCDSLIIERFYQNGVVASASPIATDIGLTILEADGNAVDAAIAVGFALAVCYPEAGNIGGGGFALLYLDSSREVRALDFRETAPGGAHGDMFLDKNGNIIPEKSLTGAAAAGVPGTVAGLYHLWNEFGSKPWPELLEPAISLADTGFIVDGYLADKLGQYKEELSFFPETGSIFLKSGNPYKAGERLIQKALANTLGRIAIDAERGFYEGKTAELIVETMNRHGGIIDYDDLKSYQPVWRQPVTFDFDSLTVFSMPPPSSGGAIMLSLIHI